MAGSKEIILPICLICLFTLSWFLSQAIDLILEPPEANAGFQRDYDLVLARNEYRASKDAFKAFKHIKRSLHTIEGQLLLNLKKFGKNLVGALNTVRSLFNTSLFQIS